MIRPARGVAVIATLAMTFVVIASSSGSPAQAVDGSQWDPGNIISDQQFYDSDAMTADQIQALLEAKVPVCDTNHPAADSPFTCLKDYRQNTVTRPADAYCTGTYQGASNELASTIIAKVSAACNISSKAILVTLQKEQGLVTNTWPSQWRYNTAMGYGCPDSNVCDTQYYGFQNQVWRAARQFQLYLAFPYSYNHRAGIDNLLRYNPNADCGTESVYIENNATAGLYNYTPYVPNDVALSNLYGSQTDGCSSFGNRNFWRTWWDWFGDPHATGALVGVTSEQRIAGADRYSTAAALSTTFAANADVVYVASGENYPDALAAAPLAAAEGASLLLVQRDAVPNSTTAELTRLQPARIVVIGGAAAISDGVVTALAGYAGAGGISRLTGADRYETARATVRSHWTPGSASLVYVASGGGFPDALSAAAAAGSHGAPVITVNGTDAHLDAETTALITELGATEIVIAGGITSVSAGIQSDLDAIPSVTTISRRSGADRYSTSTAINAYAFPSASHVFIASGVAFPDALAGAVRAGIDHSPLYIVPGSCVPGAVADGINSLGPVTVTLLGGGAALPINLSAAPRC